jgi:putative heme d1 biosynthesis radical SAM protein NirJ2
LVEYAAKKRLKPVLGTNGTLIDIEKAKKLKASGAAVMGISLDSVNPEKHDFFRGHVGAWQLAVKGMEACRETGLPFQIHTTAVDHNYHEIEEITDFAVNIGAIAHHVFFLVPTGRAVDIETEALRADRYEKLLKRIMAKQKTVDIELKPTCAPQFIRIAKQMKVDIRFTKGCLAGIAYCIINPVGDVQPCAYLDIKTGNIRERPFSEIWSCNPVFNRLRTMRYEGACGKCKYSNACGGCRARALFYYGDYMEQEPWCRYREGNITVGKN